MENRSRSGRHYHASGGDGEGGSSTKRPQWVVEEEKVKEVDGKDKEIGAVDGVGFCFICKDGGDLCVCDFKFGTRRCSSLYLVS